MIITPEKIKTSKIKTSMERNQYAINGLNQTISDLLGELIQLRRQRSELEQSNAELQYELERIEETE